LKSFFDENNKKVIICLKVVKYILKNNEIENKKELEEFIGELEKSIRS
jgi:hypothetical protein